MRILRRALYLAVLLAVLAVVLLVVAGVVTVLFIALLVVVVADGTAIKVDVGIVPPIGFATGATVGIISSLLATAVAAP